LGGILIGFFANRLDSVSGCACFALCVALLAASSILLSKENK